MPDDYPVDSEATAGPARLDAALFDALSSYLEQFPAAPDGAIEDPPPGLERYVASAAPSFSQRLRELIRRSGETDSAVYGRAGIDRRHFSKIRSDSAYSPKKSTVIAFAIALRLPFREADELLRLAGFSLSRSSKADLIVRFFLERGVYDKSKINDALYDFGQPVLNA